MRFSRRTNWDTEESVLARAHRLRAAAGEPIADLTASNPTRCGFAYPADLLLALADPRALDYDPQPRGSLSAREAVCAYYADRGAAVRPEQVVLTTSTSEAYSYLFRLLCDPGSEILAAQPGYPLFDFLAVLDDVGLKAAPLVYDHGWQIDPEGLRRRLRARNARHCAGASEQPNRAFHQAVGSGRTGAAVPGVRSVADCGRGLSRLRI
jgi:alanine-synthesizing transaminase